MNKIAYALPVLPVLAALGTVGALTACTTGSTGSSAAGSGASNAPAPTGTEVIGASATSLDATSVTVKASGVFTDTGTLKLPIRNQRTITFAFTRGNLVVLNATGPTAGPLHVNKATCAFSQTVTGTYRVLAANSTGRYAGATGHGPYTIDSSGIAPKSSDGICDTSSNATPAKAHLTVRLRGPVTLKSGS